MKIGKLVSIDYNLFKAQVLPSVKGNSLNVGGDVYYFGNIGSYLGVYNSLGEKLLCEVVSIYDKDVSEDLSLSHAYGSRELSLKPIGSISKRELFSLGVGIFPAIYSDVEIITREDMELVLGKSNFTSEPGVHTSIYVGTSKSLIGYPIELNIDRFFNIHTAVLGNSGSGKSNTISHLLQEVAKKNNYTALGARIVIFDVNGEYKNSFPVINGNGGQFINNRHYKPAGNSGLDEGEINFKLPHYLISLDEWCSFLLATDATQRPFLDRVLQECYRFYKISSEDKRKDIANYIRCKICLILKDINGQGESDTTRITAAASLISRVVNSLLAHESISNACDQENIFEDLNALAESCSIKFGTNDSKLKDKIEEILEQVDFELYLSVSSDRLREGEYYDYRFLRLAAELVLLEEDARGNKRIKEYTSTLMTRLDFFLENPECEFMRCDSSELDSAEKYMQYIWGDDDKSYQIVNLDVSELNPTSLEVVTSVLTRFLFSERKSKRGVFRRQGPIHLVLDEAHRYIHKAGEYYLKENIFEKVAREGRKFSFYLIVSSQRPSELSETVLSQCGNYIIHRIQNDIDMKYIYSVLPFFSGDFVNKIKQSVPGEALIFGNCVPMPLHVAIKQARPEPNSANCIVSKEWFLQKYDV
ncbi:ATP-binding protein [Larsenimonas suaedae]|uniref:DUF87 domain-containing protein n=1 Tax=Larsenimonas suaedae TaxID=1851019 RepID=A0ABU1GTU0_9GAMM|nr:DUF87 domain-containing protein [Larsenimonas suaedae]MCM2972197.1 DUF87 domain-containing protein [Larsenimonas suaedae]MDR5895007.1 DUF87 domain-containing protein [Larsenimonas suaedae]